MRKIFYILFLFLSLNSVGQRSGFSHPLCTATQLWRAQCATKPEPKTAYAVNPFIQGCIHDGNWTQIDRIWLYAQGVQDNAKISIANPASTQITEVNSPTWTQYQGYTGNGTTSHLRTNFNAATQGVNLTLDSASMFTYNVTNVVGGYVELGGQTGSPFPTLALGSRFTGDLFLIRVNTSTQTSFSNSDSRGFFVNSRTASNANQQYKNGVSINTTTTASTSIPNQALFSLAFSANGTPSLFSPIQQALTGFGGGGIDQLKFYNRTQHLAIMLGFNQ